jgi:opacity protein-like surface antigen
MKRILFATALVAMSAATAHAQGPVSLELRGGAALPTQDLAGVDLQVGGGFEATVGYRVMQHVHLYGGWGWYHLTTDEPVLGRKLDVENNGYAFGGQFTHPILKSVSGWARAGGLYNHLELEDEDGDRADSGHELGWEAGGGLSIPIGRNVAFTPGARYRSFSGDIALGESTVPFDMSYAMIEVGLTWRFGGGSVRTARR